MEHHTQSPNVRMHAHTHARDTLGPTGMVHVHVCM